ncbi:hypothetical protein KUTeg_004350 [Tegillarca granosa]|uniref:Uncharacterized protein n=1 Tax=Tegillarca granosa TaxID=220873 RepID=A0ABQ9FPN9_TEGGR|nr:hypothetical protein KUTeg_004350 [Tegillarca granosa]
MANRSIIQAVNALFSVTSVKHCLFKRSYKKLRFDIFCHVLVWSFQNVQVQFLYVPLQLSSTLYKICFLIEQKVFEVIRLSGALKHTTFLWKENFIIKSLQ